MAKFRQVPRTFLFKALVRYFRNMVNNYNEVCKDDDFFEVVERNCDHDKAVELVTLVYSEEELGEMSNGRRFHRNFDLDDSLGEVFQTLWNDSRRRNKCRAVLNSICDYLLAIRKDGKGDAMEGRFRELKRILRLSDLEGEILMVAYLCSQTCFCWPVHVGRRDTPFYYAMAIDRSYGEVLNVLSSKGRLMKFNVLDSDFDFNVGAFGTYLDGSEDEAIQRAFYAKCGDADILPWDFYGALASGDGELISKMISASSGKCNILFYGAPGTGKTSFAHSLAKRLGRTAFEVKQGKDNGTDMNAESRMVGIRICNEQEDPTESLMIVDEADELLRGNGNLFRFLGLSIGGKATEKGIMNALLDDMRIPTIWICNAPAEAMDESVRRRFDYSVCFERMNTAQRMFVWRNIVKKLHLEALIPDAKIESFATQYMTNAGSISTVLGNVKRMVPTPDAVDDLIAKLMKPHCRLMGIKEDNAFLPAKGYSLEGLNVKGSVSPAKIVDAVGNYLDVSNNVSAEDKPRMNILLFGPPGTGKTEFVKYLAKKLDRQVVVVRGSDILSKWVGATEGNIASAFQRAESEHAILFFDEVDGLLQDRNYAHANWEVTQVNEFLQRMEIFDGVMVAATNFAKRLDPATMRRFTFKLEFDYLDNVGKQIFFERIFHTSLSETELADLKTLGNLTPGDFRTVRQGQFYLGGNVSNADRIAALKEECSLKKDGKAMARIGFRA